MALPEYPRPAQFRGDVSAWITGISTIVSGILRGRQNIVGEVMLTADGELTTTTVIDERCHKYSSIALDPLSSEAAAILAAGTIYITAEDRSEGTFTISHQLLELDAEVKFYYTIQG